MKQGNNDRIVSALNDLLTRNYDAKKGYVEAGNDVSSGTLRKWLFENAEHRQVFIADLELEIKMLGSTPDSGSSFLGRLHRAWIDFKSQLTDGDVVVLEECIRGEERALEDYDKVLGEVQVHDRLNKLITDQRNTISKSLNSLKAIEETFAVAQ